MKTGTVVIKGGGFIYEEETLLTAMKTSLFSAGDGFTVYDANGQLVFRVESYGPDNRYNGQHVLMDASGRCLLTVRRKIPSLHQRWEGFLGDRIEGQKPIFSIRRSDIFGRSSVTVETYTDKIREDYLIEGSFEQRSCMIYDAGKNMVGEIRKKVDASTNTMLSKDTFSLKVKPGFDVAFAMGLVLVLDQINADDEEEDEECSENGGLVQTRFQV